MFRKKMAAMIPSTPVDIDFWNDLPKFVFSSPYSIIILSAIFTPSFI